MNQYFNKKKANLQSKLETNVYTSKQLNKLSLKRNTKINDYLHKSSTYIVNQLVDKSVNTLIIGKNKDWKQDTNMGRKTNQNFVSIPFNKFIDMLSYKCKLQGINLILKEESYTSKCSFFDNEPIKKHSVYSGKRIKRGLFKTGSNRLINADVNASYNIMKKAVPKAFADGIEGLSVNPLKISF